MNSFPKIRKSKTLIVQARHKINVFLSGENRLKEMKIGCLL